MKTYIQLFKKHVVLILLLLSFSAIGQEIYTGKIQKNGLLVPLLINGQLYQFMVDSGAELHIVPEKLLSHLNLSVDLLSINTNHAMNECQYPVYEAPNEISFVNQTLDLKSNFLAIDGYIESVLFKDGIDGILGAEFFNQFLWDINGKDREFRVLTSPDKLFDQITAKLDLVCDATDLEKTPGCQLGGSYIAIDTGDVSDSDLQLDSDTMNKLIYFGFISWTHTIVGVGACSIKYAKKGLVDQVQLYQPDGMELGLRLLLSKYDGSDQQKKINSFSLVTVTEGSHEHIGLAFLLRGRSVYNPFTGVLRISEETVPERSLSVDSSLYVDSSLKIYSRNSSCSFPFTSIQEGDELYTVNGKRITSREDIPFLSTNDLPVELEVLRQKEVIKEVFLYQTTCLPVVNCGYWKQLTSSEQKAYLFDGRWIYCSVNEND